MAETEKTEKEELDEEAKRLICNARVAFAVFSSIGMGIVYGLKVDFHVGLIAMVNHSAIDSKWKGTYNICSFDEPPEYEETKKNGPFVWTQQTMGYLLMSYFVGYFFGQYPGGRLAEKFSAKWAFFSSVFFSVVITLLTPILSNYHYLALLGARIVMGFTGGFSFPAMHVLLAHWSPPDELSVMSTIVYAGTAIGTVVYMLSTGFISDLLSWEFIYYIHGGLSAVWLPFWIILFEETPLKQKFIRAKERRYIINSIQGSRVLDLNEFQKLKIPWKSVWSSAPFYAILICHFTGYHGWYTLLIELPLYLKTALQFNMSDISIYASVPFLCMWISSLIIAKIIDNLRRQQVMDTTMARKIATLIQSGGPAVCLHVICFTPCNRIAAVFLMTLTCTFNGAMFAGFLCNHIDIAPNYAGSLMAVTNTIATLPAIYVPIMTAELITRFQSLTAWLILFYTTLMLYYIGMGVFLVLGSGEVQEWNNPPTN